MMQDETGKQEEVPGGPEGSRRPQEAPGGPKRPPRGPQENPKRHKRGPKRPQNGPQDASKLLPRSPQNTYHEIPTNTQEPSDPHRRHGGGMGRRPVDT